MAKARTKAQREQRRTAHLAKAARVASRLPVDASKLNMGNTYSGAPTHYEDLAFTCRDCKHPETWTAVQQKWWYEEAGGYIFTTAIRCRACREAHRARSQKKK